MDFRQAEHEFRKLKAQYDAKQITEEQITAALLDMMVQDEQGRWWVIGYETGTWYVSDGENWVPGEPPLSPAPVTPSLAESQPTPPPVIPPSPSAERGSRPKSWVWAAAALAIVVLVFAVVQLAGRGSAGQRQVRVATPTAKHTVDAAATADQATLSAAMMAQISAGQTRDAQATADQVRAAEATAAQAQALEISAQQTRAAEEIVAEQTRVAGVQAATKATAAAVSAAQTAQARPPVSGLLVFGRSQPRVRNGATDIYTYDLQSGAIRQLTRNAENHIPRWSPSGRRIAFTSNQPAGGELFDIWVMNADGSNAQVAVATDAWDEYAAWSPDESRLAFSSTADTDGVANSEIFVSKIPNGSIDRLTRNKARDEWPTWSPDGSRIAYGSAVNGTMDIWLMGADGSNPRVIVATDGDENHPTWSPDGAWIAYNRRNSGSDSFGDIWLVSADSGATRRLISEGNASVPAWSPDSKWLVFSRWVDANKNGKPDQGDESDLWVIRVSDGRAFPLVVAAGSDVSPSWAR